MECERYRVGVFVQRPYSVLVVIGHGKVVVFDSHSHQRGMAAYGALLAVSGRRAGSKDLAAYLVGFFERHFHIAVADSHL